MFLKVANGSFESLPIKNYIKHIFYRMPRQIIFSLTAMDCILIHSFDSPSAELRYNLNPSATYQIN